ncbi:winged helix-turn-helix domain-containing protein [Vibrio sp.]|uniref:winged helix-turn-helix domain-containing protein n=1 Tax=Vibrio sp. TaxID=678 RepID=UPI00311DE83F
MCSNPLPIWVLDPLAREQLHNLKNQHSIRLKGPECRVLRKLVKNQGETVCKHEILADAWHGRVVSEASLTQSISQLRIALGDDGRQQKIIKTMPNEGYLIVDGLIQLVDASNHEISKKSTKPKISRRIYPTEDLNKHVSNSSLLKTIASKNLLFRLILISSVILTAITSWHLYKIHGFTLPLGSSQSNKYESQKLGSTEVQILTTMTSQKLYSFLANDSDLGINDSISLLIISNGVNRYFISCTYSQEPNNSIQVYNFTFSLNESFNFIKDSINEICH